MHGAAPSRRFDLTDQDYRNAFEENRGAIVAAATQLGVDANALRQRFRRMARDGVYDWEAVRQKFRDETRQSLIPHTAASLSGTSTLLGPDGEVKLQWVKRQKGQVSIEEVSAIVKETFADVEPVKRIPRPAQASTELLTVIPIGDQHHGMYAWAEEAGDDYSVEISERLLVSAAAHLVDISPACETCLIVNVGDFFHYDSQRAETPQNRNALDSDSRYAKIIRGGVAMMRTFIECALAKYPKVRVINSPGNHDPVGALWLSLALGLLYDRNPRVSIDPNPGKFAYYDHGKVMLCVTHGDSIKLKDLPGIMAADQPSTWGRTEHRYGITGHIHQDTVVELPGCKVESFRTLAGRDAWANSKAYRSGRDMKSIVYHAEHGEIARHTFNVSMMTGVTPGNENRSQSRRGGAGSNPRGLRAPKSAA
jgi:hypothetical protein